MCYGLTNASLAADDIYICITYEQKEKIFNCFCAIDVDTMKNSREKSVNFIFSDIFVLPNDWLSANCFLELYDLVNELSICVIFMLT